MNYPSAKSGDRRQGGAGSKFIHRVLGRDPAGVSTNYVIRSMCLLLCEIKHSGSRTRKQNAGECAR